MGPDEQHDSLQKIGLLLVDSAPKEWHEIEFKSFSISAHSMSEMLVTYEDGRTERKRFHNSVISKAEELRSGMYKESQGTWFSMKIIISRPGKFRSEFNYYDKPDFMLWPSPQDFVQDLKHFPRDPEHIPDWLQEELRKAKQD